jgi:choline dehydrogenase-like flavoprotein
MGETYEIRNLYVADASAMPSATGVNPMISIMATAHYITGGIKGRV